MDLELDENTLAELGVDVDVRDRFLQVNVYACEDDLLPGQGIPKLRTVSKRNKSKIQRSKAPGGIEQVVEPDPDHTFYWYKLYTAPLRLRRRFAKSSADDEDLEDTRPHLYAKYWQKFIDQNAPALQAEADQDPNKRYRKEAYVELLDEVTAIATRS